MADFLLYYGHSLSVVTAFFQVNLGYRCLLKQRMMEVVVTNVVVVVVIVVEYLYSASRSASNALIVPQRCKEMSL